MPTSSNRFEYENKKKTTTISVQLSTIEKYTSWKEHKILQCIWYVCTIIRSLWMEAEGREKARVKKRKKMIKMRSVCFYSRIRNKLLIAITDYYLGKMRWTSTPFIHIYYALLVLFLFTFFIIPMPASDSMFRTFLYDISLFKKDKIKWKQVIKLMSELPMSVRRQMGMLNGIKLNRLFLSR